jgi:hypothetical protein
MKRLYKVIPTLVALFGLALPGHATVLLDDTWADGTRINQNLPMKSAWYASTGPALTAAADSMTLSLSSGAVMAITYFTTNATSPVQLSMGDTLTATFRLTLKGVAAANSAQGFRLGLFDFSRSTLTHKRLSADKFSNSSQGNGVPGYALFQNMGVTFAKSAPMDIRKRTTLTHAALLGSSDSWTSLGTGPGNTDTFPGFANGAQYILQLALQRTGTNSLVISATWSNVASGATLATSVRDNGATNFNFDGIAVRPQNDASSASSISFNEVKVEVVPASTPRSSGTRP